MGLCVSKTDITTGANIVDNTIINHNHVRFSDNVVYIPVTSLRTGERSILTIDRESECVNIIKLKA